MNPEIRKINLTLEKKLENWGVCHALREVIANALDEQCITDTKDIDIFQDKRGTWHIRDFGRGLSPEAFANKDNEEKLTNHGVCGKFGVGLVHALATFNRNNIKVVIKSRCGLFTLGKLNKDSGDKNVTLIHIFPAKNPHFLGTEYIFTGVRQQDIEIAKNSFLKFTNPLVLDSTPVGQILKKSSSEAGIYLCGMQIGAEENFLFSYNITALDEKQRKKVHRQRPTLDRGFYTEHIRNILAASGNHKISQALLNDLGSYEQGTCHDELRWFDVLETAIKNLNSFSKVVFLTPEDQLSYADFIEQVKRDGYDFITIPANLKKRLQHEKDATGAPVRHIDEFFKHYEKGFRFLFIEPKNLSAKERKIFETSQAVFLLLGGQPPCVKQIRISEKMRKEIDGQDAVSLWDKDTGTIIIKRSELKDSQSFTAALLHETAHALSGAGDENRRFEQELTSLLGLLAAQLLSDEGTVQEKTNFLHKLFKRP